jgi:TolB-like protein
MPSMPEDGRMDGLRSADIVIEEFRLDRRSGCLFRPDHNGAAAPVALGPRAVNLLALLAERHGELVSKDAIMKAVWPGRVVEEANLNVQIAKLRRLLDQGRANGSCIQTVSGRGYRFVGAVKLVNGEAYAARPASSQTAARPRPSIVVLPFTNLSDDRKQQYFADGITDDLTTDLSRIGDMMVISRNSAFAYRNKPVETKQISRELGVRYILEGSVRRSGNQVRVNVQLIDAEKDAHLWAERFDRRTGDLFALQDEITRQIAVALGAELVGAEAARPREDPDALDYVFRGRAVAWGKPPSPDGYAKAICLFERALAFDSNSIEAQSWLATALTSRVIEQMTDAAAADIERAQKLIGGVLAVAPRNPLAHFAKGQILRAQRNPAEALREYETVIALDRNWVTAIAASAWCKFFIGRTQEVIPTVEQCIRLSPRDPYLGNWYYRIGCVHLLETRVDEAIGWLEKARDFSPDSPLHHAYLAAACALKGEADRAAAELAEAQRLSRDARYSSIASLTDLEYFGIPAFRPRYEAICLAALRKAGMPEVERRAPSRQRNRLISAAAWLAWPQIGAGDEVWDFLRVAVAATLGGG